MVNFLIQDIKELGFGNSKVIIKTDQEVSIVALRDAVIEKRKAETVPKLSKRRDPKSHGDREGGQDMGKAVPYSQMSRGR